MSFVQVLGRPLSPAFGVKILEPCGKFFLKIKNDRPFELWARSNHYHHLLSCRGILENCSIFHIWPICCREIQLLMLMNLKWMRGERNIFSQFVVSLPSLPFMQITRQICPSRVTIIHELFNFFSNSVIVMVSLIASQEKHIRL